MAALGGFVQLHKKIQTAEGRLEFESVMAEDFIRTNHHLIKPALQDLLSTYKIISQTYGTFISTIKANIQTGFPATVPIINAAEAQNAVLEAVKLYLWREPVKNNVSKGYDSHHYITPK